MAAPRVAALPPRAPASRRSEQHTQEVVRQRFVLGGRRAPNTVNTCTTGAACRIFRASDGETSSSIISGTCANLTFTMFYKTTDCTGPFSTNAHYRSDASPIPSSSTSARDFAAFYAEIAALAASSRSVRNSVAQLARPCLAGARGFCKIQQRTGDVVGRRRRFCISKAATRDLPTPASFGRRAPHSARCRRVERGGARSGGGAAHTAPRGGRHPGRAARRHPPPVAAVLSPSSDHR